MKRRLLITALLLSSTWGEAAHAFEIVKFINFSDMHLSLKGKNAMKMGADSETIVKTCIQVANQTPDLDFVLLTGDLLQDGEPYNLDMIRFYLDQLKVPYYVVPGNHDMSPVHGHDHPGPIFPAISKTVFAWAFQGHGFNGPEYHWSADPVPGLHLIGLDTTVPGTWGGLVPEKEMRWLEHELAQNKGKLNLPISHHNLIEQTPDDFNQTKNFVVDNAPAVRALLEKYTPQVQFVISGHHHLVGLKQEKGLSYFSNPSTTTWPMMYTEYVLTPQSLSYASKFLPLPAAMQAEAKGNLLADAWWRPSQALPGPAGDALLEMQFLGEPQERSGVIPLKAWN
jgi:3',5'-cyclic-AMP phosphodiesterase